MNNIKTKIIHKKNNLNPEFAKYLGLKESQGKYIHFVDSDDEIYPETYTTLNNYLNNDPNFIIFHEKRKNIDLPIDEEIVFKNIIKDTKFEDLKHKLFFSDDIGKIRGVFLICFHSKVFNREWLLDTIKSWSPNLYLEDILLNIEIFTKTKKFKIVPIKLYKYYLYINTESMMNNDSYITKLLNDALTVFDKAFKIIREHDKIELKNLILDIMIYFYTDYMDYFDEDLNLIIKKILSNYDDIVYEFFNENHYQWFKKNKQLNRIFEPIIPQEENERKFQSFQ